MVIIMIVSDQMIYNYLQLKIKRRNMWNMSEPVMLPTQKNGSISTKSPCRMSDVSRDIKVHQCKSQALPAPEAPSHWGPGETAMPCLAASRLGPLAKMWPN